MLVKTNNSNQILVLFWTLCSSSLCFLSLSFHPTHLFSARIHSLLNHGKWKRISECDFKVNLFFMCFCCKCFLPRLSLSEFILHLSKYWANVKEAISGSIAVKSCIKMCENNFNVNPGMCALRMCPWEKKGEKGREINWAQSISDEEYKKQMCIYLWSVCLAKRTLPVIANESLELIRPHQIHINFNGILVSQ